MNTAHQGSSARTAASRPVRRPHANPSSARCLVNVSIAVSPDRLTLTEEVAAWEDSRNKKHVKADWQFTTADARAKLKRLYRQRERLGAVACAGELDGHAAMVKRGGAASQAALPCNAYLRRGPSCLMPPLDGMHRKRSALRTYLAACVLSVCSRASASGAPSAAAVRYQFAASAGSGLTPTAPSWVRKAGS